MPRTKKIDNFDTLYFDEELVSTFNKKSIDFHLAFCEDELDRMKEVVKKCKKEGRKPKGVSGWRQQMYKRQKLLKGK